MTSEAGGGDTPEQPAPPTPRTRTPVARPSRFDEAGRGHGRVSSGSWSVRPLNPPNRLWGSNGVAFGPDGRLYVAQYLAGQISAVDPATADVEVVVPMDGPVQSPDDLAFASDGSMYIADLVPGRVWRRSPRGAYTLVSDQIKVPNGITCVGDRLFVNEMKMDGRLVELFPHGDGGGAHSAGLSVLADGLAMGNAMQLGPDGCLYYPHMVTNQVWRVPADGGAPELVAEGVHEPVAVRFDQGGVLHVLSRGEAGIVTRIDLYGTGSRTTVTTGLAGLDNAAFDAENRMFVSSFASGGVTEMHPDGRTREIVPRGLDGPFGVTIDLSGTVYAADHYRLAGLGSATEEDHSGVTTHALTPFVHGITADSGQLHMTSQYGQVRTYDPADGATRVRTTGLDQPTGVAVGPSGELVVAETGAGRILAIDDSDTVTVLAEGLQHPADVAFDADHRCYVSDDRAGAVLRIDGGAPTTVADGLGAPQGLTVRGDELFTVDTAERRLLAISPGTGETRTDGADLPTGPPPSTAAVEEPALFVHGLPGVPRRFAGLTTAPDGSLLLSADGTGTVLRLTPSSEASSGPGSGEASEDN